MHRCLGSLTAKDGDTLSACGGNSPQHDIYYLMLRSKLLCANIIILIVPLEVYEGGKIAASMMLCDAGSFVICKQNAGMGGW